MQARAGRLVILVAGLMGAASRIHADDRVTVQGTEYALVTDCSPSQYDLYIKLGPREDGTTPASLGVLFGFQDESNHYALVGRAGRLRLLVLERGKRRVLAEQDRWEPAHETSLLIRRRADRLYVSVDDMELAELFDSSFGPGRVALSITGGIPKVVRSQPYAEIVFDDDFMRNEKEQNLPPWELVSGGWRFHSVKEKHPGTTSTHSTNPFSLGGKPKEGEAKPALVTTGQTFWADYVYQVSLKSHRARGGIVFGHQSENDFYQLTWELLSQHRAPSLIQLVRQVDGRAVVLAHGYAEGGAEQWYRLGVRLRGRRIQVTLDESLIMDVLEPQSVRGRVGLWAGGPGEMVFDDVSVRDNAFFDCDTPETIAQMAQPASGKWNLQNLSRDNVAGNTVASSLSPGSSGQATIHFGGASWKNYVFSFQIFQPRQASATLFAGDQKLFDLPFGETRGESLPLNCWNDVRLDLTEPHHALLFVNGALHERVTLPQPVVGPPGISVRSSFFQKPEIRGIRVAFERSDDMELPTKNLLFVSDPYMKHWSSPEGAWIPIDTGGTSFWHKGDSFGLLALTLPSEDGLRLLFSLDQALDGTPDPQRGYAAELSIDTSSRKATVTLLRVGKVVAAKTLPFLDEQTPPKFRLYRNGHCIWFQTGLEDVLYYRDSDPLPGTAIAILSRAPLTAEHFKSMDVQRDHVRDETFEHAYSDWVRVGTWEVTNRFSCTPSWSHLNGRNAGGGAYLWNKFEYEGDLTLEFYAGIRMRQSAEEQANILGSYPRNGDFNASFSCDGFRPDTGYTYLLTGWDRHWSEKWSYLLRAGGEVRKSDRYLVPRIREGSSRASIAWVSEGRPIHGAWYYVKIRRRGGHLEYYYDNKLVPELCFEDAQPLQGKNLALWTLDNSIMIARAKISYARRSVPTRLHPSLATPASAEDPAPSLGIVGSTNLGLFCDFEDSLGNWKTTSEDQGAVLSLDASNAAAGGQRSLKLTNSSLGGDFGALIPIPSLDASRVVDFSFNYRMPPEVRVNFYLTLAGQEYFIEFTGDSFSDENLRKLGKFETIIADGEWHHARFDLANAVRQEAQLPENAPLSSLVLGDRHEGYLRAGIGGNPEGVSYHLDNFLILSSADAAVSPTLLWTPAPNKEFQSFRFCLDARPDAVPEHGTETTVPSYTFQGLQPGLTYFHLQGLFPNGTWSRPVHYPLYLQAPLQASFKSPTEPTAWAGEPIVLDIKPKEGAHLSLASLGLTINGQTVTAGQYEASYDFARRMLSLDLAPFPTPFQDGQEVNFKATLRSTAGEAPFTLEWKLRMNHALDRTPPSPVILRTYPRIEDFEAKTTGSWAGSSYSRVCLDSTTAASGRQSLKVFKPLVIGNFAAYALFNQFYPLPLNIGKTPVLAFDYKLDPELVIDIMPQIGPHSYWRHLTFAGSDSDYRVIGQVPNVVRDGQWRHIEINLHRLLASQPFHPAMFQLHGLMFGDFGSVDLGKAYAYHIDNFCFLPVASSAPALSLKWEASDVTGIQDFSYKWSPMPDDDVDIHPEGSQTEGIFTNLSEGFLYFHIRARDKAGNWGPISHYKFFVDNKPPEIMVESSGPEARFLELSLADSDSGVDVSALKASLNGKTHSLDTTSTTFESQKGRLSWDWPSVTDTCAGKVLNGFAYQFQLPGFADFAGNSTASKEWTWTLDYSKDKEPPASPSIAGPANSAFCFHTFTRDAGTWRNWGAQNGSGVDRVFDPDRRDYCLKVVDDMTSGYGGVMINDKAFDAAQYPLITFEYKIPPTAYIHFMIYVNDVWRGITLTVPSTYPNFTNIGSANITADNTWRVATVDLLQLLKTTMPNAKAYVIHHLVIADYYSSYTPAGVPYFIDNFAIVGPGGPAQPTFTCSSFDPSGISQFRYLVDTQPLSPTDKGTVVDTPTFTIPALAPGLYYLHVSAGDGAGNWSIPSHLPYRVP